MEEKKELDKKEALIINLVFIHQPFLLVGSYRGPAWEVTCSMFPDAGIILSGWFHTPLSFPALDFHPHSLFCFWVPSSGQSANSRSYHMEKTRSLLAILQTWGKCILPYKESTDYPALSSLLNLPCWVRPSQSHNFKILWIRIRKQLPCSPNTGITQKSQKMLLHTSGCSKILRVSSTQEQAHEKSRFLNLL